MHKLIELIEKGKPFFEKISRNIYLRAIRDGFIAGMPVILFSSIFILIAYVPNAWGFHWSKDIETFLMTPYSYSMGILAFFVGGTTAKALTDSMYPSCSSLLSCRWLPWNYTYLWCLCLLLVCWYPRSFNCRTSNRCYHLCQYRCQLASYPSWTTCR